MWTLNAAAEDGRDVSAIYDIGPATVSDAVPGSNGAAIAQDGTIFYVANISVYNKSHRCLPGFPALSWQPIGENL
jgi:hypothetical protein